MSGKSRRDRSCPSGKRRFRDRAEAQEALRQIQRKESRRDRPRDRVPIRAYGCPICDGWHLTAEKRRT